MKLPTDIENIFYDTLIEEKTVLDFEQWLYSDKQLESFIESDDYLQLISLGFKSRQIRYDLFRLLEKYIDISELEKRRLKRILTKALTRNEELPNLLVTIYDLYCKGYGFLQNIAIKYGLTIDVPRVKNSSAETWEELTKEQQENILDSFYPELEEDLKTTILWLDNEDIVLTRIEDNYTRHLNYLDNRSLIEKQKSDFNKTNKLIRKPWWKFWSS